MTMKEEPMHGGPKSKSLTYLLAKIHVVLVILIGIVICSHQRKVIESLGYTMYLSKLPVYVI